MDGIKCEEVIISNLVQRGKGQMCDPIRIVLQVYTKQGELIAENDPNEYSFSPKDMLEFAQWCANSCSSDLPRINLHAVERWVASKKSVGRVF
jgi:hypothetical protein